MFDKKQFILIPYWIEEALKRKRLPLATCLDLNQLSQITSLQDRAAFLALEKFDAALTGKPETVETGLFWAWLQSIPANDSEGSAALDAIVKLSDDASVQADVAARLFEGSVPAERHTQAFDIYDLSREYVGAVIYPGYFHQHGSQVTQASLVVAMLKALYVYKTHSEVAKTALFRRYLELLAR